MGASEQIIVQMSIRTGQPIPDRIKAKPRLLPGLDLYLNAFFDLDSDRAQGFSVGRIPWTAIHKYARAYEFSSEQFDDLVYYLTAMDEAHLDRLHSNKKKD